MVEALISLTISSMLLVAVATAFTASSSAVKMNDDFFHASQTARVTLNQMITEIRKADSIQCPTASVNYFDVIRPDETLTTGETSRRYTYDAATGRIRLTISYGGGTSTTYTLASNIESASFGPAQMGQDANNATVVQRLPINLTVKVGSNHITLNGSAGPRRALRY